MNCDQMGELLDRLMDEELTDEQRRAMEAHGRECPACAEAIRQTMQMKALFAGMDDEADVPLEAQAAWRNAVKAEAAGRNRRRVIRWLASAAAAVVAVVGVGLALNMRSAPRMSDAALIAAEGPVAMEESVGDAPESTGSLLAAKSAAAANGVAAFEADDGDLVEYAAESAVVEADGATEAEGAAIYDEADGLLDDQPTQEPTMRAAMAQRAPACELAIRVEDLTTACDRVRDLVEEYEGVAEVRQADGGAELYIEMAAENALDFLSAVLPMDVSEEGPAELPGIPDEGVLLLLLRISQ